MLGLDRFLQQEPSLARPSGRGNNEQVATTYQFDANLLPSVNMQACNDNMVSVVADTAKVCTD